MAKYPGFVGPSYRSQSKIASDDRCVNWYPEQIENPYGKASWALYPVPGYEELCELTDGPVRGSFSQNGRTFVVAGETLFEILNGWTFIERGDGLSNPDDTPVTFSSNGDGGHQLFITSGSKGYVYDLNANTLTFAIDGATQGGFLNGRFLALDPTTSTLKASDLEDGTVWDPTMVAQRNAGSDRWAALIMSHKEIWLFGSQTTEVWYDAGAEDFPFAPNPSVFINCGILAPASLNILDNAPIWLGQTVDGTNIVYVAEGYNPVRVSNHALEFELSTYSTVLDARSWTYQDQGHSFYVLDFPTERKSWVLDRKTGAWHERGSWDGTDFVGLPVFSHTFAFGSHVVGSATDGKVFRMAIDLPNDADGTPLRRLRRAPHLSNENKRVIFDSLQVDLEVGLGLATGQGSDPRLMLRFSDDGGQTWSNERTAPAGAQGKYKTQATWRQLGMARDRVFEVAVSDPIPWRLTDAYLEARTGRN